MNTQKKVVDIGVILDGVIAPSWVSKVIEKILQSDFGKLKLVIYNGKETPQELDPATSFCYRLHKRLDKMIFGTPSDFDKRANLSNLIQGIPTLQISTNEIDNHDQLLENGLDLILNFSSLIVRNTEVKLARYGMWRYRLENQPQLEAPSNGYWEMIRKAPVLVVALRSTNGFYLDKAIIHRSWLPVNYNAIQINQNHVHDLAVLLIPRLIHGIYEDGPAFFLKQIHKYDQDTDPIVPASFQSPSNFGAFYNMVSVLFRYLFQKIAYQNRWRWSLLVGLEPNPVPELSGHYHSLNPPSDRFWADPFVVKLDGKSFVFVEEWIYRQKKGRIALLELTPDGQLAHCQPILEKPYHLSYPLIFKHGECYYMIPETSENRTIELYKCDDFPMKWHFVMNLMENINAVDTTILRHQNHWWLFTSIGEIASFPDHRELFLFSSKELLTKNWTAHPANPISTDVRQARPAGKIFSYKKKLYRPSQDCSQRYGRALNLNEITRINKRNYAETLVTKIEANWAPSLKGTHTFNFDKNITLIDVYKFSKRLDLLAKTY